MTRIVLAGCCGNMGRNVVSAAAERKDFEIVAGIDRVADNALGFPVFENYDAITSKADVVVDFSNPALLSETLAYVTRTGTPLVLATTGLSDEQIADVKRTAETVPVFYTANLSIGVNLLRELAKTAAKILGSGFDVEIVEAHHNRKLDAPSGTAIMLADAVKEARPGAYNVYDRHARREKRGADEIGISSIRGGTIVGEHDVIFAGKDEVIRLTHTAQSRAVFAEGALNAAAFLVGKAPGLYDMGDIIRS